MWVFSTPWHAPSLHGGRVTSPSCCVCSVDVPMSSWTLSSVLGPLQTLLPSCSEWKLVAVATGHGRGVRRHWHRFSRCKD